VTVIRARDVNQAHIGRAVRTDHSVFLLENFSVFTVLPNSMCFDPGRVNLRDRRHRWHTVWPDDLIEVEQ
jgi:hypothetical protein